MKDSKDEQIISRLAEIEQFNLTYEKGLGKVLETLQKIQDALLGKIETGAPGLMENFRSLQKDVEKLKGDVKLIQEDVTVLQNSVNKKQKFTLSKKYQKFFWMFSGGAIVVAGIIKALIWLISNYDSIQDITH